MLLQFRLLGHVHPRILPSIRPPRPRTHRYGATTSSRHLHLAVIGSGPAGFYSAHRVMTRLRDAKVDMFEKLPVPFGLVRFGVAPDHPEVKNCQDKFAEVASSPRFNFVGNVEVGKDISLVKLSRNYDAVLFAYGASQDRQLGIPGEDLDGVFSARAFVGWYNGLPEYSHLVPKLESADTAIIVGNGNVALDVARILLASVDKLRGTDITETALEALRKSRITRVHIAGRRGPLQASFTVKEVRELLELPNLRFEPIPSGLLPGPDVKLARVPKRLSQLLSKGNDRPQGDGAKIWSLDFLRSPFRFNGSAQSPSILESVDLVHNKFVRDGDPFNPKTRTEATEASSTVRASLAFRSVGYKAEPIPGMAELRIRFSKASGTIPNQDGRVVSNGQLLDGLYCAGWVKCGPTGVIATTMEDAFTTAEAIAQDWDGRASTKPGWDAIGSLLPQRVDWPSWLRIDAVEKARGIQKGKGREKFTTTEEILLAAK